MRVGCRKDPHPRGMGARRRSREHRRTHRRPQTKGQDMTDVAQLQDTAARRPIALGARAGEAYWFFGTLVTIKAGSEETPGGAAIPENPPPRGAGPPLPAPYPEDEGLYVLVSGVTFLARR